jgi:hypothetical protein
VVIIIIIISSSSSGSSSSGGGGGIEKHEVQFQIMCRNYDRSVAV